MKNSTSSDRLTVDFSGIALPEIVMAGRYDYHHAHPPLRPHMHQDIFEICLLERGAQSYFVGTDRYDLTGGDVFITKPGEVHGTGEEPENKGRLYWIEFKRIPSGQSFLGMTPQESQVIMRRLLALPERHFRNGDTLAPTFERIFSAHADRHNPLRSADVRNLLLRLILDTIAITGRKRAHPCVIGVQKALRHIEQNPANPPSVTRLAQVAGMSESYFKVTFKKETGMAPGEYANWRRIEMAKRLLRLSAHPITRLAMELGFATSQHFATVFKRLTGVSPKVFRQCAVLYPNFQPPSSGAGPDFHPAAKPAWPFLISEPTSVQEIERARIGRLPTILHKRGAPHAAPVGH